MNKSLPRSQRQFGLCIKNTLNDHIVQEKLALKSKSQKRPQVMNLGLNPSRPEMEYFDEIMKYALTTVSYPHILKGPQKVKRDIQSLLYEITSINGHNCIWHKDFLNQCTATNSLFMNNQITLEKRTVLMDWIIAVHKKYTLREETLYLTIKLIDEFAQKNDVPLKKYQLLGVTALFMASKFGEIELPMFKDYLRLVKEQFSPDDMLEMEAQILCKSHFLLSRKISALWYLEAFAIKQIIFPSQPKLAKTLKENSSENRLTATTQNQQPEQKYQKFMQFARYILNMVQLDYKITLKYKEDIVAIAVLVFTTLTKDFLDTDAKGLIKFFIETKSRLVQQNEKPEEIGKVIKKCMKKIEVLYVKRSEKRFDTINSKFQRITKEL